MRFVLYSFILLFVSNLFAATPIDGWYSSVFGGYTYLPSNVNKTVHNRTLTNTNYQSGYDAGGNFGYKNNPMRYEGELTYLNAKVKYFDVNNIRQTGNSGYNNAILALANVYYDFPSIVASIQPFLGAGIGYAWVHNKLNSPGPFLPTSFTASNSAFAYQATGGVTYNFAENYALNLGYRYVATQQIYDLGKNLQAHLANVGATYRFDASDYK